MFETIKCFSRNFRNSSNNYTDLILTSGSWNLWNLKHLETSQQLFVSNFPGCLIFNWILGKTEACEWFPSLKPLIYFYWTVVWNLCSLLNRNWKTNPSFNKIGTGVNNKKSWLIPKISSNLSLKSRIFTFTNFKKFKLTQMKKIQILT